VLLSDCSLFYSDSERDLRNGNPSSDSMKMSNVSISGKSNGWSNIHIYLCPKCSLQQVLCGRELASLKSTCPAKYLLFNCDYAVLNDIVDTFFWSLEDQIRVGHFLELDWQFSPVCTISESESLDISTQFSRSY
jgi:hypothetical protein